MAFDIKLADRVRAFLLEFTDYDIEEKNMFGGLAFLVNGKMCVNISGDKLMCRYDPNVLEEVAEKAGYQPVIMKGREYKGYCYVSPEGFKTQQDFEYWLNLCLSFNDKAKSSKK